ncbi:MAG: hypothetical protein HZA08_14145 [Nitrospirae bacterium]|nr:hypothetical protein [Nitrospirota bacterium]
MDLTDNKILQRYFVFSLIVTAIIGVSAGYIFKVDLTDNDTLKIAMTVCITIYIILTLTTFIILWKKGVDFYLSRNALKLMLAFSPIILLPAWLDPIISLKAKVIISIVAVAVGIAYFYSLHYGGRAFRKQFGIEDEGDRREKEREEKAKKEKEAKGKVG